MAERIDKHGLKVAPELAAFIEKEALSGTGIEADAFWTGFAGLVQEFGPRIRDALGTRSDMQAKIDAWHLSRKGQQIDAGAHLVLKSVHPSPLSAPRGFIGNGHFTQANAYLLEHGREPIDWSLPQA